MKPKTKQTCALILSLLLVLASASCGNTSVSDETDTKTGSEGTESSTVETEETVNIPDTKYQDYEFRILSEARSATSASDEVYSETETGDTLNDAVYTRNRSVEEHFGLKLVKVESSNIPSDLSNAVLAGDDAYDAALPKLNYVNTLIANNSILSDDKLPYLDFNRSWWNSGIIETGRVGGRAFFFVGDINYRWRDSTWALCFNKRLYTEHKLSEPYTMVIDGKWTMDVLEEHCKNLTQDINGDSVLDKNDQWGLLSSQTAGIGLITSANIITVKNDGGNITFNLDNERNINALGAIRKLMTNNDLQLRAEDIGGSSIWTDIINIFREGRALYRISIMSDIAGLRDMNDDFGILPLPKYDESHEYSNTIQGWSGTVYVVPMTAGNTDRTSSVLEYMAYASKDTVADAYYDVNLQGKVARDEDSAKMLDIIFGNMYTDLGLAFEWGGMRSFLKSIINSDTDNTVSTIDSKKSAIQAAIDDFVKAVNEN